MELASRANITALSTVHDSFATVAADYNNLNLCTREAFVWMYEQHDVLNDWRHELEFHSGVELSDPPPTGDLDLGVVRDSEYFFS